MRWRTNARSLIGGALLAALAAHPAAAGKVGEGHLIAHAPSAALRDASHRDEVRITVWYPAAPDAVERPLDIGPPGKPFFTSGRAAPDAAFEDQRRHALILLSHGFGGTARIMAWFGTALARHGYVVVAVDHPGNNGRDTMTIGGAVMYWERPRDLGVALARVESDAALAPHLDPGRLGVAGFSAGGFTSLAAAGVRIDVQRFRQFCAAHPDDGVCAPQKEFSFSRADLDRFLAEPAIAADVAHADDAFAVPGVKAVFVMAPAIIQSFDPASLKQLRLPVGIILGDADHVATPATNGEAAAAAIPGARLRVLPGVGHYDFLADCTPAGDAARAVCPTAVPRAGTHEAAIDDALALFGAALGQP
ncbi:MAG: alpha/beta hydrolase [Alphaproteobacteria bacterium]|nr:alpha/beta hydrolase [Alphaproteobacteria bacterium]